MLRAKSRSVLVVSLAAPRRATGPRHAFPLDVRSCPVYFLSWRVVACRCQKRISRSTFVDRDVHQVRGRVHGRGLHVRLVERRYTKREKNLLRSNESKQLRV